MTGSDNKLALPVGTTLQQYKIESVLGYGGFGIVYKARHKRLDIQVAIKEYLPQMFATREANTVYPLSNDEHGDFYDGIERFLEEAKQLVKFDEHPNVVKCRDFFEENGTAYLVMNFEDGGELAEILKERQIQNKPLNERQILSIILPILSGLGDIHAANVLHRDIKPTNIFIRRKTEQPVLIDFGAAKQDFSSQSKSSFIHTEGYAPIEQIVDEGNLGPWTDLYAVGAMMWRIIASRKPPRVQERMMAQHRNTEDPMTSALELGAGQFSQAFLQAIDKSLQLHEQDRFQSAAEFIAALPGMEAQVAQDLDEPLTIPASRAKPAAQTPPNVKYTPGEASAAAAQSRVSSASSQSASPPTKNAPNRLLQMGFVAVLLLVVGAFSLFMLNQSSKEAKTAEGAKPSESVVFSKIERMYEQSNSEQNNLAVIQGYEIDKRSLDLMAEESKAAGDSEDYQDTMKMIQRLTSQIQEAELAVLHASDDKVNTAFELAKYYKEWGSYISDLFEQKISLEKERGNNGKANVIDGFYLAVKNASRESTDNEIREHLKIQLDLKG